MKMNSYSTLPRQLLANRSQQAWWIGTRENYAPGERLKSSRKKCTVCGALRYAKMMLESQFYAKNQVCKHLLGMRIRLRLMDVPIEGKCIPMGQKRKRGRPSKSKKALLV